MNQSLDNQLIAIIYKILINEVITYPFVTSEFLHDAGYEVLIFQVR